MDRFSSYFLPKGSSFFKLHTWVQLGEYYEFKSQLLLQKTIDCRIKRMAVLDSSITIRLLSCVLKSEDITKGQEKEIEKSISQVNPQVKSNQEVYCNQTIP